MPNCIHCGQEFSLRGIQTHQAWCKLNPYSAKYEGDPVARESSQPSAESKSTEKGLMDRLIEELEEKEFSGEEVELPWGQDSERLERVESTIMESQVWLESLQVDLNEHFEEAKALSLEKETLEKRLNKLEEGIDSMKGSIQELREMVTRLSEEEEKEQVLVAREETEPALLPSVEMNTDREEALAQEYSPRSSDPDFLSGFDQEMRKTIREFKRESRLAM